MTKSSRGFIVAGLHNVERAFYVAVALALALAGGALFLQSIYTFFIELDERSFSALLLEVLDSMLFVFIVTELIHTVRAVIAENVLMTEPFLIVGIVAAIRRLILLTAETQDLQGAPEFGDAMVEMGLLVAVVIGLGLTIFLLRHTTRTEPRPGFDPDDGSS